VTVCLSLSSSFPWWRKLSFKEILDVKFMVEEVEKSILIF